MKNDTSTTEAAASVSASPTVSVSPNQGIVPPQAGGMSWLSYFNVLWIGIYLGIVFVKSEVARWERIHDMFLFREAHMYLIISVAIVVAMVSMLVIRSLRITTIEGKPIQYQPKPFQKGIIFGGMLFGAGWAITGACPGPIFAQIGGGAWMALVTLSGALLGMLAYAALKPRLPH